jgi:hypothetical protein
VVAGKRGTRTAKTNPEEEFRKQNKGKKPTEKLPNQNRTTSAA